MVDLRSLDIHSLLFCSCIIGFSSLLSGRFVGGGGGGGGGGWNGGRMGLVVW